METGASSVGYVVSLPKTRYQENAGGGVLGATDEKDKASRRFVKDAYAEQFKDLRSFCEIDEASFFHSLETIDSEWQAKGGKSGAKLAKTMDDRYIVKEISEIEFRSFVDKVAPRYFEHIKSSQHSCLAKIFRVYQDKLEPKTRYVIVMENIKHGKDIGVLYDLKGKLERKFDASDPDHVRTEEEFMMDVKERLIYINQDSKNTLQDAISHDAQFLKEANIMDYSLLVGVDENRHELVCGIIDYLSPYNAKKMMEWLAKSVMMTCYCTSEEPTVLNPGAYMKRFRNFIENQFLSENTSISGCTHFNLVCSSVESLKSLFEHLVLIK